MKSIIICILVISLMAMCGCVANDVSEPTSIALDYLIIKYKRNFEVIKVTPTGSESYVCTVRDNNLIECLVTINADGTIDDTYVNNN